MTNLESNKNIFFIVEEKKIIKSLKTIKVLVKFFLGNYYMIGKYLSKRIGFISNLKYKINNIRGGNMNIQWIDTILTSVTIFFASIIHGIAGFGLAQISMGFMPLFRNVTSAAVIFSMIAVVSNFRVWFSVREEFDVKDWIKPVIGLVAGIPLGLYVFNQMDENQVKIAIGSVLLVAVVLIILREQTSIMKKWFKDVKYEPKWIIPILVGFIAGIFGGAVAIPGPPMILYGAFMASTGLWSGKKMKAIFTAFFGTLMLYRVATSFIQGNVTLSLVVEALIALPAMLLGVWIGIAIFNKIPQKTFQWVVIGMLTINAFVLLLT